MVFDAQIARVIAILFPQPQREHDIFKTPTIVATSEPYPEDEGEDESMAEHFDMEQAMTAVPFDNFDVPADDIEASLPKSRRHRIAFPPDGSNILFYFGAGWDLSPLSRADYRHFNHFVFIDALPKIPHYTPIARGYKCAKNRQSFVFSIHHEAAKGGYTLTHSFGDTLIFRNGQKTLEYHINMTVEESLADQRLHRLMYKAKKVHVHGFFPHRHGFDFNRDTPNVVKPVDLIEWNKQQDALTAKKK